MKLGLINSAFAQANKGTRFGLEQTKRIGFDTVDVFTDPLDINQKERTLIKATCAKLNLPIKSICCVAVGLIDFNPSVARYHVERVKKYLDLCKEFGCDNLLLVIGEYIWQQEVIPPAEQWKTGVANVREVGKYAKKLGLEIAIELEPFDLSLVNSVDTMLRFLDDVGLPNVLANCDIAHLHLSDCNGKTHGDLPPGRGVTPIKRYLAAIRGTGFDRTVSIELEYSPKPDRIVEWVTEAYEQTDRIMRELDCRS